MADPGVIELLDRSPAADAEGPPAYVFPTFDEPLFEALRAGGYRKIVLQVPAGLLRNAHDLAARLRSEVGASVVLAARACFGACDFPSSSEVPGAQAAVVLGHARIPNVRLVMPTYFVEMRESRGDAGPLAALLASSTLPRKLGLVASVQHLDLVDPLQREAASRGIRLSTGTGDRRLAYPGQALGCNYISGTAIEGEVAAFLFLGTGRFHPIGLAIASGLPVYSLDPVQGRLEGPIDRADLVRRRQLLVATCRNARKWGILVSSFTGQNRSAMATALQQRAIARGHQAEILVFGRLDPADLEGRDLDAYVNTACPRIALDDSSLYARPLLTPPEFLMAIGDLPLEPYRFDTYH